MVSFALALSGCNPPPGAVLLNNADQTVLYTVTVTGEEPTAKPVAVAPEQSATVPIPPDADITVTATYESGFPVNALFTQSELQSGCKSVGDSYQCRFHFDGQKISMTPRNPAEDFASGFAVVSVAFAVVLLTVTIVLFVRNRRNPIDRD